MYSCKYQQQVGTRIPKVVVSPLTSGIPPRLSPRQRGARRAQLGELHHTNVGAIAGAFSSERGAAPAAEEAVCMWPGTLRAELNSAVSGRWSNITGRVARVGLGG